MQGLQNIPIVHATTVHPWWDNRVSNKMVNQLARSGLQVYFIVNSYPVNERPALSNLHIITLDQKTGFTGIRERIRKNLLTYKAVRKLPEKGIFHFHDPEMIFIAALLRLQGWKIVYDIHEDLYQDIAQKPYLGSIAQKVMPQLFRIIEKSIIIPFGFTQVIAEKTYRSRYPKATTLLNYPEKSHTPANNHRNNMQRINLLYSGVIQKNRGTNLLKPILQTDPAIHITLIGRCSNKLQQEIEQDCCDHRSQLTMITHPDGIPFREIIAAYRQGNWTAGMVIFPDTPLYKNKEPTKFFEYIQFSIPILASDFPLWRDFVGKQRIGLCINPNPEYIQSSLASALEIFRDRQQWESMRNNCKKLATQYSWESQQQKLIQLYKEISKTKEHRQISKC